MQPQPSTGVEVLATHNPMAFLLAFCTPTVVVDGTFAQRTGWNRPYFFPLAPGRHTVKIFFRYLWMRECGANSVAFDVSEGRARRITYSTPSFIYAKGRITAA